MFYEGCTLEEIKAYREMQSDNFDFGTGLIINDGYGEEAYYEIDIQNLEVVEYLEEISIEFYEDYLLEQEDFPTKNKYKKKRRNNYYRKSKKHKKYRRQCGCDYCVDERLYKHNRKIEMMNDMLDEYEYELANPLWYLELRESCSDYLFDEFFKFLDGDYISRKKFWEYIDLIDEMECKEMRYYGNKKNKL